jgi:hypothetical protein
MSKHEDRGRAPRRIPILNIPGNSDSLSAIVHDLGYAAPDPNAQLAALLAMPRDQLHSATLVLTYLLTEPALLERVLDVVIAVLDTKDGNTDLEPSNDLEDVADDTEQDDSDREPDDEGDDDPIAKTMTSPKMTIRSSPITLKDGAATSTSE